MIRIAALLGLLAVGFGAFGAHGLTSFLDGQPDAAKRLAWWATGARYQMWHALMLLGVALAGHRAPAIARALTILVIVGVVLFSGSLFAMALTNITVLGAITPVGGLSFLAAWGLLIFKGNKLLNR